ncbi:MAG: hypothetical protein WAQ05_06415 [Rubrivivax sp.]
MPRTVATPSPFWHLWAWPLALGLLSCSGLLSALVSDSWGDAWSWLALGVPVLVMVWFGLRRKAMAPQVAGQRVEA